MDSTVLFWTLVSTVLAGVQIFIQKVTAHEGRNSAFSGFLMYATSGVLSLATLFFVREWSGGWKMVMLFGVAAGLLHGVGNFIRIEALRHIDSVLYFPINKVVPIP